jgi:hypothetical protein
MPDKIEIADITPEQEKNLRGFLGNDPLEGFETDKGTVRGDCVEVDYQFDPSSRLLTVTPKRLPEHLQDKDDAEPGGALREMLEIARNTQLGRPGSCGIYDYVLITLDNQSGQTLTYSSQVITSGTVTVQAQTVPTGQSLLAIQGQSRKGSIVGSVATVVFTFADGVTTLTIDYALYSAADASYNAGLSGANSARFKVASATTGGFTDGYTYMEPTTTITKA